MPANLGWQGIGTGAASAIVNAATRSAIDGSSFGDNIRAAIPDVIGQALGNSLASALFERASGDSINEARTSRTDIEQHSPALDRQDDHGLLVPRQQIEEEGSVSPLAQEEGFGKEPRVGTFGETVVDSTKSGKGVYGVLTKYISGRKTIVTRIVSAGDEEVRHDISLHTRATDEELIDVLSELPDSFFQQNSGVDFSESAVPIIHRNISGLTAAQVRDAEIRAEISHQIAATLDTSERGYKHIEKIYIDVSLSVVATAGVDGKLDGLRTNYSIGRGYFDNTRTLRDDLITAAHEPRHLGSFSFRGMLPIRTTADQNRLIETHGELDEQARQFVIDIGVSVRPKSNKYDFRYE